MPAAEVVPFISREDAKLFIKQHGGEIFVFESIPRESIFEMAE